MLQQLLKLLADGRFHSGEALGERLGVSRAAVWKALKRLEEQGFPLQSVRGKGYRLPRGASLLDQSQIIGLLPATRAEGWEWYLHQELDSTNAEAQRLLSVGGMRPLVCLAERQTAGRGRRGRVWQSPYGQNIYMTVVVPFDSGAQRLEGLSLMVGMVLVDTLEAAGYKGCRLKWPNDVLLEGAKLAGILVEVAGDLTAECAAVIGVGVNVLMTAPASEIDQAWTSLRLSGQGGSLDRNTMVAGFVARLDAAMELFRVQGFAPFAQRWSEYDAWHGLEVKVTAGASVVEGLNRGVTERGALRLLTVDGEQQLSGGEVSLRLNDAT